MAGDWQSGTNLPNPKDWLAQHRDTDPFVGNARVPEKSPPSDLPVEVYGEHFQIWHDQHLMLQGPIVSTLEAQFGERWRDAGRAVDLSSGPAWLTGQVIFSTSKAYKSSDTRSLATELTHSSDVAVARDELPITEILALSELERIAPAQIGAAKVQMWRTIPLRKERSGSLLASGEFTYMAGIAKACNATDELIWIFDQYCWNMQLARQLNRQLRKKSNLRVIIILPPYADSLQLYQHHRAARRSTPLSMVSITIMSA